MNCCQKLFLIFTQCTLASIHSLAAILFDLPVQIDSIKKYIVFFASTFITSSGYSQNPPGTIGVGIVTERVDSTIIRLIKVINAGQSNIIAFPAEYSQKRN